MGSKYKSPLIRSRNTSATTVATSTPDRSSTNERTSFGGNDVLVHDNIPRLSPVTQHWRGRGCSSPRIDSPRQSPVTQHLRGRGYSSPRFDSSRLPRGSPYLWTPPQQTGFSDKSWSSQQNNSGGHSTCRPQYNKYKKKNSTNYQNRNNESIDESYFHPSMLEDPWAQLLNNSANDDNE